MIFRFGSDVFFNYLKEIIRFAPYGYPINSEKRLVLLCASNLTMALPLVASLANSIWRQRIELFGALGYGRSYGTFSQILGRTLPGILQYDLWKILDHAESRGSPESQNTFYQSPGLAANPFGEAGNSMVVWA